ncbi:hypothetical protein [Candidatus Nitrosoglobus terrae]|nr:hypothetical protein [Candidatus Nitrosoglobus terrae]
MASLFILGFIAVVEPGKSTTSATPTNLLGTISDENGFIKDAELSVTDSTGMVRATASLNGEQGYDLELPVKTVYPVIISATYHVYQHAAKAVGAKEDVPVGEKDEAELRTAILESGSTIVGVSLSPISTQIVDIARARGGITPENIAHASAAVLNLDSGEEPEEPRSRGHEGY